jgi:integrase/recombinase XerD
MATLKVILHPINKDKDGKRAIVLRMTHLGIKYFVSMELNYKLDKLFDNQLVDGVIKPLGTKIEHLAQKNAYIATRLSDAHNILLEWERRRIPFSIDRFKDEFNRKKAQDFLFPFFEQVVTELTKDKKLGNASIYISVKNSIKSFRDSKQLRFSDITLSFLQKYQSYLFENGLTGNGISLYMRTLRAAYNRAIKLGIAELKLYPFHNLQNPNGYRICDLETATTKRAILLSDIRAIEALQTQKFSMEHDARLYFLFSFYCRGMNFIDMALLKPENCQSGRIIYTRAKTRNRKVFTIEILPPVKAMIEYFAEHPMNGGYLLPILNDEKYPTEQIKRTTIHSMLKKTNACLKTLGTDAKIKIPLTTYVARHSWATVMKYLGTSISVISEGMGHPDEKTTQIYLEEFENNVLDDANRKLLV